MGKSISCLGSNSENINFVLNGAMGKESSFVEVKLFCGIIFHNNSELIKVERALQDQFSAVDLESSIFPFTFTNYYNAEMGQPLYRKFVTFATLIQPEELSAIKLMTNKLELDYTKKGRRAVNLDPGFLSEANVIIATTKNHYHRVPLQQGIYAHIEYVIHKKQILALEWTYPDFQSLEYQSFFYHVRTLYKTQLAKKRLG